VRLLGSLLDFATGRLRIHVIAAVLNGIAAVLSDFGILDVD